MSSRARQFIVWCVKHGVNVENRADALGIDLSDADGWSDRKYRI